LAPHSTAAEWWVEALSVEESSAADLPTTQVAIHRRHRHRMPQLPTPT
jgi:hypothetical protein